jgi:hypothetical protein
MADVTGLNSLPSKKPAGASSRLLLPLHYLAFSTTLKIEMCSVESPGLFSNTALTQKVIFFGSPQCEPGIQHAKYK